MNKPFYPPFVAVVPLLALYAQNSSLFPIEQLWRPAAGCLLVVVFLWVLAGLIGRSLEAGAMFSAVMIAGLTTFGFVRKLFPVEIPPAVYVIAIIALAIAAAIKVRATEIFNFFGLALFAISAGNIAIRILSSQRIVAVNHTEIHSTIIQREKPDIFYIILDGYGRSDALKRSLGYDNSAFIKALKDRGFFVAEKARANYCQTELSLASSLNLDLIPRLLPEISKKEKDRHPLDELIARPLLAEKLKAYGYRFYAITTGFPAISFPDSNLEYAARGGLSLLESAFLDQTPLRGEPRAIESQFLMRRDWLNDGIDTIGQLAGQSNEPRFVFAHILAPHPPFVFMANGDVVKHRGMFGYYDGSDYFSRGSTREQYRTGYSNQAEYISRRILASLDKLLNRPGPKPIIVLQGDHGSKLNLDQDSLERTDVSECFPNLNAYFVPQTIRAKLYDKITPVNSFRIILSGLFGENLPLREDRNWYSRFPAPYDFTDVTDKIVLP